MQKPIFKFLLVKATEQKVQNNNSSRYCCSFECNSHLPTFEHFIRMLLYTCPVENCKNDKLLCKQNAISLVFFSPLNFEQLENSINFVTVLKTHTHLNNSTVTGQTTV